MSEDCNAQIPTPLGPVKVPVKKMAEVISVLSLACLVFLSTLFWSYVSTARAERMAIAAEIRADRQQRKEEMAALVTALGESTRQARIQTCIMGLQASGKDTGRESAQAFCERISR